MVERLELALLGYPELQQAGQPLARLRSAKAYALLYYLAVTRRAQPRTVLAGLFWGDVDEYYARRNLNRTLSDLNQAVGDHLIVERQSLAFAHHQPYWLDVELLEAAGKQAPTAQTLAALAAVADRYRGDFLEGFYVQDAPEFEQWVLTERTRLRACALQLHHTLAEFHADQGELSQAMTYARRILQLEPWREEAHRQLILWLAQSGQRSAALAQYELCRQALHSELDVEPTAATLELVAQIRADTVDQVTRRPDDQMTKAALVTSAAPHAVTESSSQLVMPHNLPGQRTPFIGRVAELAELTRLLVAEEDCRLLTLIGPGGMGKTRLALKAAEQIVATPALHQRFADGIFFVPLENVSDSNGLVAAMLAVLALESSLPRHADTLLTEQLFHFLRNKALLLVLDNFEHLVKHAELCSALLIAAPKVKLLITTRDALNLQEAWFYPVLGLTMPPEQPQPNATRDEYDAVQLFAQCARRMRPNFVLETERGAVLRICTLVEGMPLAIELAAAWLKVMTCDQIAQEVARGLDFLTARYQNIPARHRSMRVVMDQAWALLAADEAAALARLAVFRGQFRQEAANAITGASLFTLAALAEKALVRVTPDGYYQLHELTRQYAEEQITSASKTTLRDAHATYYANLLDQQRPSLLTRHHGQVWATVGGELDNIRHAWAWIVEAVSTKRCDLPVTTLLRQMARVFAYYYLSHSLALSGQALFASACQAVEAAGWATGDDPTQGQYSRQATSVHLQLLSGLFHLERGHYRASLAVAEPALAACRRLGLEEDLLQALLLYGRTQMQRGVHDAAVTALQEALTLGQHWAKPAYCAEALTNLGMEANNEGRYAAAQAYLRQALALWQEIGYRPWIARTLTSLGTSYIRQYDYQQALPYYEQALAIAKEEGNQLIMMINTSNLGSVQYGFRQYPLSIDYYQRSLVMARSLGEERWIAANLNGLALTYLALGELTTAERTLREALMVGQQSDSIPDTLGSIGQLGHVFARRGQLDSALKALLFVEQHPATMARDHLYNEPLLVELRSELPATVFAQAAAWAASQGVESVVRWLLHGQNLIVAAL